MPSFLISSPKSFLPSRPSVRSTPYEITFRIRMYEAVLSQHFVYSHDRTSKCNMRGKQETLASFLVCSMYSFHILDKMQLVPAL